VFSIFQGKDLAELYVGIGQEKGRMYLEASVGM
jgi:hypothetical protein